MVDARLLLSAERVAGPAEKSAEIEFAPRSVA